MREEHVVYKYEVPWGDEAVLTLPQGAQLLHVDTQRGTLCVWALVTPGRPLEARRLRIAGTGHPLGHAPGMLTHLGSVLVDGGRLVFHVFEVGLPVPEVRA